ncbi:hypothetical protein Micbo1qcDRAFT_155040 [Microdochium bolleyi]|uniref:Rhodopsin domain-containing protein n=1 Tax=Microdochium bolleyi TaxID=196109 RepID=A0A136JH74_9PEZI|nr:hypothetical protein Micbo1qcDRAFT_155040 [Microdochium bolleyi]
MVSPLAVIASEWTVTALAYIFLGLRITVRITQRQINLVWSEVWLVLGALWLLGLVICDTITYQQGGMEDFIEASVEIQQIRFASNYLFDAGLYFPKISMVVIYFQLLPRHDRPLRWALYFTAVFTVGAFIMTIFVDTFWCGANPSINWSTVPGACASYSSEVLQRLNWAFCFLTEVMLLVLPFPLLKSIRTAQRHEFVSLIVLFALGIITIAVSAGRFATMVALKNDISIYIWATTEFAVSQIIVSSMALRPLMKRIWSSVYGSSKNGGRSTGQANAYANAESRRISTAKVYTHRTAVRINEHGGGRGGLGTQTDVWGPNDSEVELQTYGKHMGSGIKVEHSHSVVSTNKERADSDISIEPAISRPQ